MSFNEQFSQEPNLFDVTVHWTRQIEKKFKSMKNAKGIASGISAVFTTKNVIEQSGGSLISICLIINDIYKKWIYIINIPLRVSSNVWVTDFVDELSSAIFSCIASETLINIHAH